MKKSIPFFCLSVIGLLTIALSCGGGGGGGDSAAPSTSQNVSSTGSANLTLTSGTRLTVPAQAVPQDTSGNTGTLNITMTEDSAAPAPAPSGMSIASNTVTLGPDNVVLNRPVRLGMALPSDVSSNDAALMRYNESTNSWNSLPFGFDPQNSQVVADMIHFSHIALMKYSSRPANKRWCRMQISNLNTGDEWATICISSQSLVNAEDSNFTSQYIMLSVPPAGTPNMNNNITWFLPQGDYTFQVSFSSYKTSTSEGTWGWMAIDNTFTLDNPDTTYQLTISAPDWDTLNEGRAPCMPSPTPVTPTSVTTTTTTTTIASTTTTTVPSEYTVASECDICNGQFFAAFNATSCGYMLSADLGCATCYSYTTSPYFSKTGYSDGTYFETTQQSYRLYSNTGSLCYEVSYDTEVTYITINGQTFSMVYDSTTNISTYTCPDNTTWILDPNACTEDKEPDMGITEGDTCPTLDTLPACN